MAKDEFDGNSCGKELCSTSVNDNIKISLSGSSLLKEALGVNDPFLFQVETLKKAEQFTSAADLYGVSELNREEMWKLSEKEQEKHIKKNFHRLIRQCENFPLGVR